MERLEDCILELTKFTLESYLNGAVELDLGISKEFCSGLLRDDPVDPNPHVSTDPFEGVPSYPLYRRLSMALLESIISGAVCKTYKKMALINEDILLKQEEEEWDKLILQKRSEFVNILKDINFELHVQEPFFSLLKDVVKTIEGRCALGDYNRIGPGALILINKCLAFAVQEAHHYPSFSEMLKAEDLPKVLPGVKTIEEGVQVYRKFYTEEKERSNGVIAIHVSKLVVQPYNILASLLSGLNCMGVRSLLGLAHTTGTILDALPPPKSTLLESFMLPYKRNVKGSTLTTGARALAKHAVRSSDKFWGSLNGSADGYGARWSKEGTKFIGFLEPYMDDGHSRGWKH